MPGMKMSTITKSNMKASIASTAVAAFGTHDAIALPRQQHRDRVADRLFVVDDEDAFVEHHAPLLRRQTGEVPIR